MSSLRRVLAAAKVAPVDLVEEVEFEGEKYVLKGSRNADAYFESILMSEDDCNRLAKHWRAQFPGKKFKPDMVRDIAALHMTLQPEEGEEPYDITEIVELAVSRGDLYLTLSAAASKVLGLTQKKAAGEDADLNGALGNSSAGADSGSSNAASERPDITLAS